MVPTIGEGFGKFGLPTIATTATELAITGDSGGRIASDVQWERDNTDVACTVIVEVSGEGLDAFQIRI